MSLYAPGSLGIFAPKMRSEGVGEQSKPTKDGI